MDMFENLGATLRLTRELRGRSQADVARKAGVGKSQLSKYENGKELPRLDSLSRILAELEVSAFAFFYTLHLIDEGELAMGRQASDCDFHCAMPVEGILAPECQDAFQHTFDSLLALYRAMLVTHLRSGAGELKKT